MGETDSEKDVALRSSLSRVVAYYQRVYDVSPTEARRHGEELRRYLLLCSKLDRGGTLPTPKVLDRMWHVFLLHTREYAAFCDALGYGFIHHVPSEETQPRLEALERYRELLYRYEVEFHEPPPAEVWTPIEVVGAPINDCDAALEG
ncbi:MAG: hypothetical protein JWL95_2957 [Gemmatimonadetes bacterium]|nr:hypothetical protein [Gemmatimonadota bacterium]